jgi:hypothetical protein
MLRMRRGISVTNHSAFFRSLVERESKIKPLFQAICFEVAFFLRERQDFLQALIPAQRVLR